MPPVCEIRLSKQFHTKCYSEFIFQFSFVEIVNPLMTIVPFLEQDLPMINARFLVIVQYNLSFDLYDSSR